MVVDTFVNMPEQKIHGCMVVCNVQEVHKKEFRKQHKNEFSRVLSCQYIAVSSE